VHNVNVSVAESPEQIKSNLVAQLDSPVRWVECVQAMSAQGAERFIESGPGRVLSGMVKRIVSGAELACLEKPDAYGALL